VLKPKLAQSGNNTDDSEVARVPSALSKIEVNLQIMKKTFSLLGVGVLLAFAAGCATPQPTQETRAILVASGFHTVAAKTSAQRAHLQTLPPGKIAVVPRDGKTWYVYPDAAREQIYVGNQSQFQSFRMTMQDAQLETWQDGAGNSEGDSGGSSKWVIWVFD